MKKSPEWTSLHVLKYHQPKDVIAGQQQRVMGSGGSTAPLWLSAVFSRKNKVEADSVLHLPALRHGDFRWPSAKPNMTSQMAGLDVDAVGNASTKHSSAPVDSMT